MGLNPEVSELFDVYGDVLTDKQKDAVRFYYDDDLSLSEIAENYGVNRQAIHDSIKRAEVMLYDMEKKLGIVAKTKRLQKSIDEITALAREIEEINQKKCFSSEITVLTDRMLRTVSNMNE